MTSDVCAKCDKQLAVYCRACYGEDRATVDEKLALIAMEWDVDAIARLRKERDEARAELEEAHREVDGQASRGVPHKPVPLASRIRAALRLSYEAGAMAMREAAARLFEFRTLEEAKSLDKCYADADAFDQHNQAVYLSGFRAGAKAMRADAAEAIDCGANGPCRCDDRMRSESVRALPLPDPTEEEET